MVGLGAGSNEMEIGGWSLYGLVSGSCGSWYMGASGGCMGASVGFLEASRGFIGASGCFMKVA